MANLQHIRTVRGGKASISGWVQRHSGLSLDLSEADLSGIDLSGVHIEKVDFSGAKLSGSNLEKATFRQANFSRADFSKASLLNARFEHSDFTYAIFDGANLTDTKISQSDFSHAIFKGANLTNMRNNDSNFSFSQLSGCVLKKAHFAKANLTESGFRLVDCREADFQHATIILSDFSKSNCMDARFGGVKFHGVSFVDAQLQRADFKGAKLEDVDLANADLFETRTTETTEALRLKGLTKARNVEAMHVENEIKYIGSCGRPFFERNLDWERLRTFGNLPLFGASYLAVILIPVFFYLLGIYNEKVQLLRVWAKSVAADPSAETYSFALVIAEKLHPLPIPSQSLILLISTVLLAVASTIYVWKCPSRIKEFSRDKWCDELRRPLLHYWGLAWKGRTWRIICAFCYIVGGVGVLWVIGTKIFNAGKFIVQNAVLV